MAALAVPALSLGEEASMPTIQEVKAKHERRLLALPGVVSFGIGRGPDGAAVLIVGLDGPRPETVAVLPKTLDGFPVRTEIIGTLRPR
jgi:hypothetical protein